MPLHRAILTGARFAESYGSQAGRRTKGPHGQVRVSGRRTLCKTVSRSGAIGTGPSMTITRPLHLDGEPTGRTSRAPSGRMAAVPEAMHRTEEWQTGRRDWHACTTPRRNTDRFRPAGRERTSGPDAHP